MNNHHQKSNYDKGRYEGNNYHGGGQISGNNYSGHTSIHASGDVKYGNEKNNVGIHGEIGNKGQYNVQISGTISY